MLRNWIEGWDQDQADEYTDDTSSHHDAINADEAAATAVIVMKKNPRARNQLLQSHANHLDRNQQLHRREVTLQAFANLPRDIDRKRIQHFWHWMDPSKVSRRHCQKREAAMTVPNGLRPCLTKLNPLKRKEPGR